MNNEELSKESEAIIEMFDELFDKLKQVFDSVSDSIKELWNEIEKCYSSNSDEDNGAHLACATPASQINVIGSNASYAAEFTGWKFVALILALHLKIPPIGRLRWSGL